jgi:hypothetical protein
MWNDTLTDRIYGYIKVTGMIKSSLMVICIRVLGLRRRLYSPTALRSVIV